MKNKPNKYGIKHFTLCHATTGYVLNCDVYIRTIGNKNNTVQCIFDDYAVIILAKVTVYRWAVFIQVLLFLIFYRERKLFGVGTVMKNRRGLPFVFKTKQK